MKSQLMYRHSTLFVVIIVIILTSCNGNTLLTATHTPFVTPTSMLTPTAYVPALQGTPVSPARDELSVANADQIVQLAKWGKGVAIGVKYSPDGRYLAISSRTGVYLFNAESYDLVSTYKPGRMGSADIAFFPDGRSLLVTTEESVDIVSIPDFELKQKIDWKARQIAISPDGKLIAVAACAIDTCYGDQVQIYLLDDLMLLHKFFIHKYENEYKYDSNVINEIEFSPDGLFLGVLTKNQVIVWNLVERSEIFYLDRYSTGYFSLQDMTFSPDGKYFALCTYDEVLIYGMGSWSLIYTLKNIGRKGSSGWIMMSVAFSPDGRYLAAGSDYIITWQISDGQLIRYFGYDPPQYAFGFTDLAWSKDGTSITSTANLSARVKAQSAVVWDATNGSVIKILEGFLAEHASINWSSNGSILALKSGWISYWALQLHSSHDGTIIENH